MKNDIVLLKIGRVKLVLQRSEIYKLYLHYFCVKNGYS